MYMGFPIDMMIKESMRRFAQHYPSGEFSQALPAELTWTHHVNASSFPGKS